MSPLLADNKVLSIQSSKIKYVTLFKNMEDKHMQCKEQLEHYLEYCKYRKELDAKTLKAYRIDLCQFFDFVRDGLMNKKELEAYITWLHKNYKQKTIKRKIASVKAFYNYLEDQEEIRDNPFRKIRVRFKEKATLPRIIPKEEIEQLLNYMYQIKVEKEEKVYCSWLRDLAVTETFFATGARVYEISNILLKNVNLNEGIIMIMGKGGKERCLQIVSPEILNLLRKYYELNREKIENCGYFFINNQGNRYTEQSIRLMLKKYTEAAGISRHITPHMFRHSVATYLIENGVDVSYVQKILGHSSIKTTQIYIHIADWKQAEILRELHPRNKLDINGVA